MRVQNGGQPTFDVRAQFARYALTQPQAVDDGGRFNATELHCTEYFPGTTAGVWLQIMLDFIISLSGMSMIHGTPGCAYCA